MTIEVLYPEICCLFGDKANARYLAAALPEAEFVYTALDGEPRFVREDVDMIYLASMSETSQQLVTDALLPHRARLEELIDHGCVMLATGNAFEIFGEEIRTEKGESLSGLCLLPIRTERHIPNRSNSLFLGSWGDMPMVGYTSRFSESYYLEGAEPLFAVEKGYGMNRDEKREGVRRKNFFGTHLLGPLLIQNPDFMLALETLLGAEKPSLPWETEVREALDIRLAEFRKDIGFYD